MNKLKNTTNYHWLERKKESGWIKIVEKREELSVGRVARFQLKILDRKDMTAN